MRSGDSAPAVVDLIDRGTNLTALARREPACFRPVPPEAGGPRPHLLSTPWPQDSCFHPNEHP